MSTTSDLSDFGFRELELGATLLRAYCDDPPCWLSEGVHRMMNKHSGFVFLTDDECNVAMMNGDRLNAWLFTPHDGHEGFVCELAAEFAPTDLHSDDAEFIRHWADILSVTLPENWHPNISD